ncbi:Xylose isomerase domain-containing protein TIM barrel [Desulfovibrio sp. X2]|uniref:metabolite traffic protein EboE n=1 Tax=Desulfovibrio sp. X2 TaxID=941449 RepID=UPI000358C640|nr:metabolite traffic protein EboE [Desulfovibrio sp. X2]EPR41085.1 Xylose isomerase domain-containing protein TIM barrel [Desulfovibrio sp. X2]
MSSRAARCPATYCTNIHPGETWAEALDALVHHGLAVRAACAGNACDAQAPFPIGLRVSGTASRELDDAEAARFAGWLAENGLSVRTVNGFPYGRFHHAPVKEQVYLPDWRDPERAAYTLRLARFLDRLLPQGGAGSISSVPLGFRKGFPASDLPQAYARLRGVLEQLDALAQQTGRFIRLSLEPEPGCLLETSADAARFFADFRAQPGLSRDAAAHLALCYDCCHQALQYEDPAESLALLASAQVPVGHVQVSSALHLDGPDLARLARFAEPVYLHQAVARRADGALSRFDDLPEALAASAAPDEKAAPIESWRVHFHLPVFLAELPECASTQAFLSAALPLFPKETPMEVETYTWSVLPPDLQTATVTESIVREIAWVEACRTGGGVAERA